MDDENMRLAGYIQECIRCLPSLSTGYSIYQVPENLRSMNEAAYRPLIVSIGPFYCKDERLRPMEEYKLRYLSTFMNHLLNIERLKDYIEIIRGKEEEIRQYYLQKFELNSDEFTKMVMLDSVFIIELFRRLNDSTLREENDPLFYKPRMIDDVYRDLQLLENQLPIFIIEFLYNSAFESDDGNVPSFSSITCKFFNVEEVEVQDFKHFVDLLRTCHLPSLVKSSPNNRAEFCSTVSATCLYNAGVKFVPFKGKSLLDIEFDRGSLKMQPLYLDDWTEHFFRNLMVFEQCHHIHDSYIIDYIAFLGDLIKTPDDVEILVRYGVLKNLLGNTEDALNFFNTLDKHAKLPTSRYYYSDVCMKLDKFYNDGWNRSIAMLKQKYFAHPRAAAAIIYAVVILILSIVNSATGVISNINGC